jgi:hypothetical protein
MKAMIQASVAVGRRRCITTNTTDPSTHAR